MNKRQFLSTAAASMLAMGVLVVVPAAHAESMGKCFGVATVGHNDCAGLSGLHSCKGTTTMNYNPGDFVVKPTGTCEKLGGLTMEQAKAILANPAQTKAFEEKMQKKMGA
ncbi:MAG: DUF2282 domain-containing protein [Betaproteobacteria bacterium]|nr:DUF2282 domain-containing protein [Betaproteobacteria bacterium]MDE2124426.1 DUF2282 domain-containing protein [Betaproteobacteria bacterium]MDE2186814.1 DUF2282 domain-containing protein [Betaproteobacteria bacterium]MDE2326187.1 DUF2282 domain-containing protein [Betaproteobacteria bacterium]